MHNEDHIKFRNFIENITSDNPLQDINLLQWLVFISALFTSTRWVSLLWSCSVNLLLCTILKFIIAAPRPFEVDTRLRGGSHRGRYNYGFPSTETHLAVVLNGSIILAEEGKDRMLPFLLFLLTLLIGFTRVYSCARFVHQIAFSYATGFSGLMMTVHLGER